MKKILIVEDEAFAVMSLKYYLEEQGFSCTTAATEAEALSEYSSFCPDFILMDVSLADGSDGISAAEKIIPIVFLVIISLFTNCTTSTFTDKSSDEFMAYLKNEITNKSDGNAALILVENGEIYDSYYFSKGSPVNSDTLFQIASISKFVTTVGILKLVEQGHIDLDFPVSEYLTSWQLPESKFDNNKVTIRRLLSHTGGLIDGLGYKGFYENEDVQSLEDSLTFAKDRFWTKGITKVGIEPGTRFKYSGGGFTLLQLVIEEVTDKSFNSFMKSEIFEPLDMDSSTFIKEDAEKMNLSECFTNTGKIVEYMKFTSLSAASLFISSADMYKFIKLFLKN